MLITGVSVSLRRSFARQHGQATCSYLAAHDGTAAAAEFQRTLSHRGTASWSIEYPLAQANLGRAYAIQGDPAKARVAYQDFLDLWKDADPDIPILKQAKAEYAGLQ